MYAFPNRVHRACGGKITCGVALGIPWRGVTKHWTEEIPIEFCKFIVYLLSVWVRFGIHLHKHIEHEHTHARDDRFRLLVFWTRCRHTHPLNPAPTHTPWYRRGISIFGIIDEWKQQQRKTKSGEEKKKTFNPCCTVCLGTCDECLGLRVMRVCDTGNNLKSCRNSETRVYEKHNFAMKNNKF